MSEERNKVVEEFIARYRREQDFYTQAARIVAQTLESRLQAEGIRAIVTDRAKAVGRLEPKVRARATKANYQAVGDVYDDIVDLAGVRVALYFPGQREQVGRLIDELFTVLKSKKFPGEEQPRYEKRFSGYWATHSRVRLREVTLPDAQKRYADARVEIQVASVLMHAWSEVEHDLVYKPLQGELSEDEYAILDELNGLVIAGEIGLERLQRAGEVRVASSDREFSNHFELATHLLSKRAMELPAAAVDSALGRVDLLFDFLRQLGLSSPSKIERLLEGLHSDYERRPISEQIIDQLLSEEGGRYATYENLRSERAISPEVVSDGVSIDPDQHRAFGKFMSAWIELERTLREHTMKYAGSTSFSVHSPVRMPSSRMIEKIIPMSEKKRAEFERVRRMRNYLVHGVETPPNEDLMSGAKYLEELTKAIVKKL